MKSPWAQITIGLAWILTGSIEPVQAQAPNAAPNPAATRAQGGGAQNAATASEASISEGKSLYQRECVSCHGPAGKGDGPDVNTLKVKPTDLSSQEMWLKSDAALSSRISEGKTPMPSFRSKFSKRELEALVSYIRTLAPKGADNASATIGPQPSQTADEPTEKETPAKSGRTKAWIAPAQFVHKKNPVAVSERSCAEGKELYQQECLTCHGSAGKGDGRKANTIEVAPANLTSQKIGEQSDGALFWKINKGNPPMPSFRLRFSSHEVWLLVNYLRSLSPQNAVAASPPNKPQGSQSTAGQGNNQGGTEMASAVERGGRTSETSRASNDQGSRVKSDSPLTDPRMTTRSNRDTGFRSEYCHVLINPLPIYGLASAVLVLAAGLILRNRPAQLLALGLVVLCAASAWPTYLTGEKAYHRVYARADSDGQVWLDAHKHRAEKLIYAYYLLGVVALGAALIPAKAAKTAIPLAWLTLLIAFASLAAGAWIAKAGGQIRHPEFRNAPSTSGSYSFTNPN